MKNIIRSISLILFIFTVSFLPSNTNAASGLYISSSSDHFFSNVYSWSAEPGAVNYTVDLVQTENGQCTNLETSATQICLLGMPVATYNVTVRAELTNGNSFIIIEEVLDL